MPRMAVSGVGSWEIWSNTWVKSTQVRLTAYLPLNVCTVYRLYIGGDKSIYFVPCKWGLFNINYTVYVPLLFEYKRNSPLISEEVECSQVIVRSHWRFKIKGASIKNDYWQSQYVHKAFVQVEGVWQSTGLPMTQLTLNEQLTKKLMGQAWVSVSTLHSMYLCLLGPTTHGKF